jgi:hypothetical protein
LRIVSDEGDEDTSCVSMTPRSSRSEAKESRGISTIGSVAAQLSVIHAGSKTRQPSGCSITK